ncbi:MAG: antitoxin MazE family protein [Pseudolabrys sp.]
MPQRKTNVRKTKPLTSREKVRSHRQRLRAKGMRPVTIWVPDIRSPKFAAEARRQCVLANNSRYAAQDQAWVDSMSDGTPD